MGCGLSKEENDRDSAGAIGGSSDAADEVSCAPWVAPLRVGDFSPRHTPCVLGDEHERRVSKQPTRESYSLSVIIISMDDALGA